MAKNDLLDWSDPSQRELLDLRYQLEDYRRWAADLRKAAAQRGEQAEESRQNLAWIERQISDCTARVATLEKKIFGLHQK